MDEQDPLCHRMVMTTTSLIHLLFPLCVTDLKKNVPNGALIGQTTSLTRLAGYQLCSGVCSFALLRLHLSKGRLNLIFIVPVTRSMRTVCKDT